MKDYYTKIHIIEIKGLNKDTSLKSFITHFSRYNGELCHDLIEVGKNIVKSYNGLSMS